MVKSMIECTDFKKSHHLKLNITRGEKLRIAEDSDVTINF